MFKIPEKVIRHKETIQRVLIIIAFVCCFVGCWKKQTSRPVAIDRPEPVVNNMVRVLLHDSIPNCKISSTGGFSVSDSFMTSTVDYSPENKPVEITAASGLVRIGERFFGSGCVISTDIGSLLKVNGKLYRGVIKLYSMPDGQRFRVINELHIEEYLAGVVGAEMPSFWDLQALKAQAVAARTYCLYTRDRFGKNRQWDVKRTQANQMYNGVSAETATVKKAVKETSGMVLTCSHRDGNTGIFPTYYSSTCGGHTESSYNTFGEYFSPLNGAVCQYCKKSAPTEYMEWGPVHFTMTEINSRILQRYPTLARLENIESVIPGKKSNYGDGQGRTVSFRLTSKNGQDAYLKGEDLRLSLDPSGKKIKSSFCDINKTTTGYSFSGKGFGHGVGMCQYGAMGMAREGKDYRQILSFYYPTAKIATR